MRYKIVPATATQDMVVNATEEGEEMPYNMYLLMLAAAPNASEDEGLVQRVAKCLCEAVNQVWPEGHSDGDFLSRLMFVGQARAVLKMLEG